MTKRLFAGAKKLLFERAAQLRKQPTYAEEVLWQYLRCKPMGFKFRRQHPFSNYILDFYCHQLNLVIEVDGGIHEHTDQMCKDRLREEQLKLDGVTITRFTNEEVLANKEKVIQAIELLLQAKRLK